MKKIKIFSWLVSLVVLLGACSKNDDERKPQNGRTVLVYVAGDNTLRGCIDYDLEEMLQGMQEVDDADNNLLVYIDNGSAPQLVRLTRDKKGQIVQDVIITYQSRNSVSVSNMREVIETAFSEYPATGGYGLVLWSHGEGWIPSSGNTTRWWGQDGSNYLDISDLREVLKSVPHLDFLLFDACFMQSIEVAYELKDCANYIIGSPTEIPAPGAPYQCVVPAMFSTGDVAKNVAQAYFEYYADPVRYTGSLSYNWSIDDPWTAGVSVSVIKTDLLNSLASVTGLLLPKYIQNEQVISTSGILCYDRRSSKYYYDFDGMMKLLCTPDDYTTWKSAFDDAVVYWKTTERNYSGFVGDFSMNGSAGLSTYIPRSDFNSKLNTFFRTGQWFSAAGWAKTGW